MTLQSIDMSSYTKDITPTREKSAALPGNVTVRISSAESGTAVVAVAISSSPSMPPETLLTSSATAAKRFIERRYSL
jgi:hypothetical protein